MQIGDFPADRTKWFRDARFGMFIHWGLYSVLGHGEWAMNREQIPLDEYVKLADRFDAADYSPEKWAELAKQSGMKYMVLTTKHHEGFCLWNSKTCSFNSVNSAAKRDLVADYVSAARKAGLKVGFYYSLGDWYNPDWMLGWQGDETARVRFMDYTWHLIEELMTNYGKIDILWYDLPQNYSAESWRAVEINAEVRRLQPHILINNRAMTSEDFTTPEQEISSKSKGRMWEACITLNGIWGYCPGDINWKSPQEVAAALCKCASGCGNLLLNIGPDGKGRIPHEATSILEEVGNWLKSHGEAIYASTPHRMSWNMWGLGATAKNNVLYIPASRWNGEGKLVIGCLATKAISAELLTTGQKLTVEKVGERTFIRGLPHKRPDALIPIIKVECNGVPGQHFDRYYSVMDIFPSFP
jgi:alpha-L-fucosidase